MKKIKRIWNRSEKRVVAVLLAMVFILTTIFTTMSMAGFVMPTRVKAEEDNTVEVNGEKLIIRDDALHFYFRHWHTAWDQDAQYQDMEDQLDTDSGRYFVIVEGYIIPHTAEERENDPGNNFTIALVNQNTGELLMAKDLYNDYLDENGGTKLVLTAEQSKTEYLGELDKEQGLLELKVKKLKDQTNGFEVEKYCGISLSAGRGAVQSYNDTDSDGETDSITIKYSEGTPTHIVKGHIFYSGWWKTVSSSSDLFSDEDTEVDAMEVYTAMANLNGYKEGDVILDENNAAITDATKLPEGCIAGVNVQLTKFYSAAEGLHTNKTLVESADGRIFLIDLEAWYVEGYAAQLGYVIDASGSMAGTSDTPSILNLYDALMDRLDVEAKNGNYYFTDLEGKTYKIGASTLSPAEIFARGSDGTSKFEEIVPISEILAYLTDKLAPNFTEGWSFTKADWNKIYSLIGAVSNLGETTIDYVYPQRKSMIGYYEITANGNGNLRTWYFNSIAPTATDGIRSYVDPTEMNYSSWYTNYFALAVQQGESEADGGNFNFKNAQAIREYADYDKLKVDEERVFPKAATGWGNIPASFSGTEGVRLGGRQDGYGGSGFMLSDASTPEGDFTLSFDMYWNNPGTSAEDWEADKDAEILYIGKAQGEIAKADFRLVRKAGGDLVLWHNEKEDSLGYTLSGKGDNHTFTFTYDKVTETVTFYVDGRSQKTVKNVVIENIDCVVFDPFDDRVYNANITCGVNDIFVYNTILTGDEVSQLFNVHGKDYSSNASKPNPDAKAAKDAWSDAFIGDTALTLLMNPMNTAHVPLGVAAYNYYVYEGRNSSTDYYADFSPLGYWDGTTGDDTPGMPEKASAGNNKYTIAYTSSGSPLGVIRTGEGAGWYFVSHSGTIFKETGTAKQLFGLANGQKFTDKVTMSSSFVDDKENDYDDTNNNTSTEYTATSANTTRFYLDASGNLRCFFNLNASVTSRCSYVYKMEDSDYVKTEALQRILAYFNAEMAQYSPSSEISAVQYSSATRTTYLTDSDGNQLGDAADLVLLDWSSEADEISGILSQRRGSEEDNTAGAAGGYDVSAGGVNQYNFALTGSTTTELGLQEFFAKLVFKSGAPVTPEQVISASDVRTFDQYRRDKSDPNVPKFVIVFTDGANSGNEDTSIKYANALKKLGYTVIGMYIPGGADPRDSETGKLKADEGTLYNYARGFLSKIAGTAESDDGDSYVFASTEISTVANIFETQILAAISGVMDGYTVKDYIDPRFDLQNADGAVWHLNAGGSVEIERANGVSFEVVDSAGKISLCSDTDFNIVEWAEEGKSVRFHLAGTSAQLARDPYLRYDSSKDMYYLQWVEQTIPSTPIGSDTMLPVWSANIILIAKDDFIGGNAVLTNGNEKNMNYVYHIADTSEKAYADWVFDSWQKLSSSLRDEYIDNWKKLATNAKADYVAQWGTLKAAEPNLASELARAWSLTDESDESSEGGYVMFMIAKMNLKRTTEYDASSGTGDMTKTDATYDESGNLTAIDQFPSKGFPRIAVNVSPNSVLSDQLVGAIYLGEVMSPGLVLNNMVLNNGSNNYLGYLARYAYYLYPTADTPLLELLKQVDSIADDENGEKSFSVPYMYLPDVQYAVDGKVMQVDGKAVQLNNAGTLKHKEDILGILTYHLKQVGTEDAVEIAVVNEDFWDGLKYSLTVEFTLLDVDDSYEAISALDVLETTIGNGSSFDETFEYDRNYYLKELVQENAYKPTVQTAGIDENLRDLLNREDTDESDDTPDRVQQIVFDCQANVVGAELALELKIYKNQLDYWKDKTIVLELERSYTPSTTYAQELKQKAGDDYGSTFYITYKFNTDNLGEPDKNELYTLYEKASIKGTFGDSGKLIEMTELPVGNYSYNKSSVTVTGGVFNVESISAVTDRSKFLSDYFGEHVSSLFGEDKNLINAKNITNSSDSVIYFGTANGVMDYDSRIAMLNITMSPSLPVELVIKVADGGSNESFLFKITDEHDNYIIVSVHGSSSTTVIVPFGTYTVEEISDWSWKYTDGEASAASGSETYWEFDGNKATTVVETSDSRTVIYSHKSNGKTWLGGEYHNDWSFEQ